jgi:hypothetical protein
LSRGKSFSEFPVDCRPQTIVQGWRSYVLFMTAWHSVLLVELPATHGAILALRAVAIGGTVATIALTDRRRSLSARQVRRRSFLPAAT